MVRDQDVMRWAQALGVLSGVGVAEELRRYVKDVEQAHECLQGLARALVGVPDPELEYVAVQAARAVDALLMTLLVVHKRLSRAG
ncbi:hypothetical protein TH66_14095 [Carbonactinospora thermoautotrophica]|uniref:Uncharacterized protein n=2 Tax=Carbonactinospora thermoautotrophica TaxID=1469144 RepID=A0A132NK38_9ACTN|nr:hypothetical protein [Carbonactinospora thermoautotrophica]KWX00071.1 hypothetical protein TH66_14095 [Carbonactinospora thermoautotrophica]KWX10327.1 hypothetical protein TR74_04265 [Carbonactinospora thermoautotrophica]